jgi:hypothetical protein
LDEPLLRDFAKIAPKNVATAPEGEEQALRRFFRGLAAGLKINALSKAGRNTLEMIRQSLRACGQGIVVAGTRVGVAQILENIVEDAIQGIHIGLSNPEVAGSQSVKQVVLSRNTVHCLIPSSYMRDRHGIFVGNARSISITDTVATLRRTKIKDTKETEVEGIRVHGVLGPFMVIRQNNLSGFPIGIRVVPENQPMATPIWVVTELLATDSKKALDASAQIQRDRISP